MRVFFIFIFVLLFCGLTAKVRHKQVFFDASFPAPKHPFGNGYSAEKALLGRYFFYEKRLSINGTKSCGSCHDPAFSFTDGYRKSVGALGDGLQRNAPPLVNLAYNSHYTWANKDITALEKQIVMPLFSAKEMGLDAENSDILRVLEADLVYKPLVAEVFPHQKLRYEHVVKAVACFVRTLVAANAPYDQYTYRKNAAAVSSAVLRGEKLFFGKKTDCSQCHSGINFNEEPKKHQNAFFNIGLYNIDGSGSYPNQDQGLVAHTGVAADMGRFRVPTLRNLAFTAPYMHDGSMASLGEVVDFYAQGGQRAAAGGEGRHSPLKDPRITGFMLSAQERTDLLSFLWSLSDSSFVQNPAFANPF